MPNDTEITETELVAILRDYARGFSVRAMGEKIGVSGQFVSDVLHGKRNAGPKIAAYFGYRPIAEPRYEKV